MTETEELHEWTVVSDCLIRPDEAHEAIEILTPAAFSDPEARDCFAAIRDLHESGHPADVIAVTEHLERSGKLTRSTIDRLHRAGLQERCATPISFYARKVLKHHQKRQVREIVSDAHNHLCNGTSVDDAIANLIDRLGPFSSDDTGRTRRRHLDGFVAFPLDSLPKSLRSFVRAVSQAIGCDPVFVVLPLLAACSGAIGNSRRLRIKGGWFAPSILWCVAIGESGQQKSPPLRFVTKPFWTRQQDLRAEYSKALAEFKDDQRQYKSALKRQERSGNGDVPHEPLPPVRLRCLLSDTTVEGIGPILRDNPRGCLLSRDELSGWLGSFDKYSGGGGKSSADAAAWLSIYNAESIDVSRKEQERDCFVERPAVSICGTIQPGVFHRAIGSEHRENGLLSRILMAFPPRTPKEWTDAEVPLHAEEQYDRLIGELFNLQMDTGSDGLPKPAIVGLDDYARGVYKDYCNETGQEQASLTGDLAAAWSKLEEIPARLALVLHCVRQAGGESVDPDICDVDSMTAGVEMARWFKNEVRRVYGLLGESQEKRDQRQVVDWIRTTKGGRVRPRDVLNGRREIETAEDADKLLSTLAKQGFGSWHYSTNQRGPTAREFVLFE